MIWWEVESPIHSRKGQTGRLGNVKKKRRKKDNLGYVLWKFRLWKRRWGDGVIYSMHFIQYTWHINNHNRITFFNQCFKISQQQKICNNPILQCHLAMSLVWGWSSTSMCWAEWKRNAFVETAVYLPLLEV